MVSVNLRKPMKQPHDGKQSIIEALCIISWEEAPREKCVGSSRLNGLASCYLVSPPISLLGDAISAPDAAVVGCCAAYQSWA